MVSRPPLLRVRLQKYLILIQTVLLLLALPIEMLAFDLIETQRIENLMIELTSIGSEEDFPAAQFDLKIHLAPLGSALDTRSGE